MSGGRAAVQYGQLMVQEVEPQGADGGDTGATAISYEDAAARVEAIIRRLDSGEASLSETLALVKEGKALIERCASELDAVSGALEELRLEDLVARLEAKAK